MAIDAAYIAVSTNRHSHAADISSTSVAAFGSSNLVALWGIGNKHDRGVSETLPGHEGLVTCVRFVSDVMFVSADDMGILICWRKYKSQWNSTGKVQAHAQSISAICAYDDWVVTGSSDASVKIWKIMSVGEESDELVATQVLPSHGKYSLTLALTCLPQSKVVILAIAGTDSNVQIWAQSDEKLFVHAAVLAGHEDWVRSLAFLAPSAEGRTLALASGSQDATIRLWLIEPWSREISAPQNQSSNGLSDELLDAFEASLADLGEAEEGGRQISMKRHILTVKSKQGSLQQFSVTFDALLIGHDAGITSLSWRPSSSWGAAPTLLSTSTDSSLILWSPSDAMTSAQDSIWINRQRFGDIGGQRLGGFVGGGWALNGKQVLAWGWNGGWRRWYCNTPSGDVSRELWEEIGAITGHSGPVKGIDWSPNGKYLLSAGIDQTTRVHGAIPQADGTDPVWHELSRPQVHGYDLLDVAFLGQLKFVSIADEKVARVFNAPRGFVQLAGDLGVSKISEAEYNRPSSANVPPLGLSNKAVSEDTSSTGTVSDANPRRPFEGELALSTLWPEIEKVFGHGYESITLAVSPSKRLMATACKATTAEHAVVRVYNTEAYQLVGQPLAGHSLTVTRIAFSPDDRLVLSVSRDRSWRLYEVQPTGGYSPVAADKSHARIIWDCAWASESDVFATASRDKTVKIWQCTGFNEWKAVATIKTSAAATAVDFSPGDAKYRRRLAIGLETGEILIYSAPHNSATDWRLDATISSKMAHVRQIHRLAWRPASHSIPTTLASCGEDGTMKILIVQFAMD